MKWILLILGGSLGTLARYGLAGFVYQIFGSRFPYGTLVVNLLGCFLIGLLVAISDDKFFLSPGLRLFLMVGFCGAFTTFSTFILETGNLLKDGEIFYALGNVILSVVVGFLIFRLGVFIGNLI